METNKTQLVAKLIFGFIIGTFVVVMFFLAIGDVTNASEEVSKLAENYKTQMIFKQKALMQRDEANMILEKVNMNMQEIQSRLEELRKQNFILPEELKDLRKK